MSGGRGPRAARALAAGAGCAAALALAGCGGSGGGEDPAPLVLDAHPIITLEVSRSLEAPLTACAADYAPADVRVSGGSPATLEARLRRGEGDILATDDPAQAQRLNGAGLLRTPETIARDELVLAVPAEKTDLGGLEDLEAGDSEALIAIGADGTPFGTATIALLSRLPSAQREAVLARVRTMVPDGRTGVSRVRTGAVDGAIVRASDVQASGGTVRGLPLPAALGPGLTDAAAVTRRSAHPDEAAAVIDDLQSGTCGSALRAAGFLAP